jgi:hypothetical protein
MMVLGSMIDSRIVIVRRFRVRRAFTSGTFSLRKSGGEMLRGWMLGLEAEF